MFSRFFKWLFKKKPQRIAFIVVPYGEAEKYLADGWVLAPEEDANQMLGVVFLEKFK